MSTTAVSDANQPLCWGSCAQNAERCGFILAIIVGLGALTAIGFGVVGHLKVFSELNEFNSMILLASGGGAAALILLIGGIIGSIKGCQPQAHPPLSTTQSSPSGIQNNPSLLTPKPNWRICIQYETEIRGTKLYSITCINTSINKKCPIGVFFGGDFSLDIPEIITDNRRLAGRTITFKYEGKNVVDQEQYSVKNIEPAIEGEFSLEHLEYQPDKDIVLAQLERFYGKPLTQIQRETNV